MKILVTGSTGFLGPHVIGELLRRRESVRVIVRDPRSLDRFAWLHGVECCVGDLTSMDLKSAVSNIDLVIHIAAVLRSPIPAQHSITVTGTCRLLEAMADAGVGRLVLTSSLSVYCWHQLEVLSEDSTLDSAHQGRDAYVEAKLRQEQLVEKAMAEVDLRATVLRLGTLWGPGRPVPVINLGPSAKGIQFIVGPRRNLPILNVKNAANCIAWAMQRGRERSDVFNVLDDPLPEAWEFYRLIQTHTGKSGVVVPLPLYPTKWVSRCLSVLAKEARLPSILPYQLVPANFAALYPSFKVSNEPLIRRAGWSPPWSYKQGLSHNLS